MFENLDIAQLRRTALTVCFISLRLLFILSISFIGLWLELLPISERWVHYWPMWSAIAILIWSTVHPSYEMIAYAWFFGLILDNLYGNKLGTHAIGLSLVSYLSCLLQLSNTTDTSERINQLIWVFFIFVFYQFVIWLLQRLTYIPVTALGSRLWIPSFFSTILWFVLVDFIRVVYSTLIAERQFFR